MSSSRSSAPRQEYQMNDLKVELRIPESGYWTKCQLSNLKLILGQTIVAVETLYEFNLKLVPVLNLPLQIYYYEANFYRFEHALLAHPL